MRGKRGGRPCSRRRRRLIPAYAGKTNQRAASARVARAHPRVCGENPCFCRGVSSRWGSSPRMRGKPRHECARSDRRRLIPAYAGKTLSSSAGRRRNRAHPRVCGENFPPRASISSRRGSSPRMRGKPRQFSRRRGYRRLIPAYAGKTVASVPPVTSSSAHPRVCGENSSVIYDATARLGSSPRMRGKLRNCSHLVRLRGLIPAYAGKTSTATG